MVWILMGPATCLALGTPRWVKEMPSDPCYFFGRAQVDRTQNLDEDRKNARDKALSELAMQIKAIISSETKTYTEETNGRVSSHFQEAVSSKVENLELTGYQTLEHRNKKFVWALCKLSRDHYYANLHADWHAAKTEAIQLFEQGQKADLPNRLLQWSKAVALLAPYKGQSLRYQTCGRSMTLDNRGQLRGRKLGLDQHIVKELRKQSTGIELIVAEKEYTLSRSRPDGRYVTVKASRSGTPQKDLLLELKLKADGWKIQSRTSTNDEGNAQFKVEQAGVPGRHRGLVTLAHSPGRAAQESYGLDLPQCPVMLYRPAPLVVFALEESNLGNPSRVYVKMLKELLCGPKGLKEAPKNKAEILVRGSIETRQDGTQMGLCKSRAHVDLEVIPKGKTPIRFTDHQTVGLMRYDFAKAGEKALRKAAKKHSAEIMNRVLSIY